MGLSTTFTAYIKFIALLSPLIIIPCTLIFGSLLNQDLKGLFYILGLVITMTLGGLLAAAVKKRGPGVMKGETFIPAFSPACNIVGESVMGYGTKYTMPCPDALALAYTMAYLLIPMFLNNNINFFVIGAMLLMFALNTYFRICSPMFCVDGVDVVAGLGTGIILGAMWFLLIQYLNGSTYFENEKGDNQKCKLDKKSFRCKKTIKVN